MRAHAVCLRDVLSERLINADPLVKSSIMFGHGKFQNGVLIEPIEEFQIDPRNPKELQEYRNEIWFVRRLTVRNAVSHETCLLGLQ